MIQTEEIRRGRLVSCFHLLFLALVLHPRGGGAVTATSNFKVIGSTVVRAGGNASLTCDVDPYPDHASFIWVRNGKVIEGQNSMTLDLQNVTKQDVGSYQCGTADSAIDGEGRLLHVFTVGDALPAPYIDHIGVPVIDRDFALQCIFLETYIPSGDTVYTWYKNDKEIKGQNGPTLNFTKVAETDIGTYTCTAWEGDKSTTSPLSPPFHLTALVSPKVNINRLPSKAHVKAIRGENLTLNCEVNRAFPSVPDNGYTWSFSCSSDVQNRSLGGHGSSLFLGPLTTAQSGQYFCEARTDNIFRLLTLVGQASVTVDVVYLANITLTPSQVVDEGDQVTLTCHVDSHPTARLSWTVNGTEVRHVTDNLDHYVIMSAACSDSNNYTCGASNPDLPGLEIHATVQLTVLCKQVTTQPHFTTTDVHSENTVEIQDVQPWMIAAYIFASFGACAFLAAAIVAIRYGRLTCRDCTRQRVSSTCPRSKEDHRDRMPLLNRGPELPASPENSQQLKQKICFDDVYLDEKVLVLPPVEDSEIQHPLEKNVPGNEEKRLKEGTAMALFVKDLKRSLETTVRPGDPPVIIFRKQSCSINRCTIFHKSFGVITLHIEFDEKQAFKNFEATIKSLLVVKKEQEEEFRNQLNPQDVLIVLVLPNLSRNDLPQKIKKRLQKKQIQILRGKEEADITAWLKELNTDKQPWALKWAGSNEEAFKMAVQECLMIESYGASSDPPFWLATMEQLSVLLHEGEVLHVWGPLCSGKTLLLLDKVREWLSKGKTVMLAACDPSYEPHLHRLASLAVRDSSEGAEKRLLLCTHTTELKKAIHLRMEKQKSIDVGIAMANTDVDSLTEVLQYCKKYALKALCTTGHEDISPKDEQMFRAMGGRSFHLSMSFCCTGAILELANQLLPSQTSTGNLNTLPCLSDRPSVPVKVAYHPRHPDYRAKVTKCGDCQTWLSSSLSPLEDGLNLKDERWKSMVVLLTGDWGSNTNAKKVLRDQLRRQGIPAVLDSQLNSQVSSPPTSFRWSKVKSGKAAALERVEIGVDTNGHPAVHMLPATSFRGLEKPCVLVVHYDWRDDHPDHQSQEERDARLREHRQQLHVAVTRCQTELAVLLLSPSPAAAPLLKYTSGGEQDPAAMTVETEV